MNSAQDDFRNLTQPITNGMKPFIRDIAKTHLKGDLVVLFIDVVGTAVSAATRRLGRNGRGNQFAAMVKTGAGKTDDI